MSIYNYQGEIIEGELSSQKSYLESQIKELQQQIIDLKNQHEYLQYLTIRKFQQEFNMTLTKIFKYQKQIQQMETIFNYSLTKFTQKLLKQEIQISIPRNSEIHEQCVQCKQKLQNSMIEYEQGNHDFIRLTCRHFIHLQCLKESIKLNILQKNIPMQCLCQTSISPFALLLIKDSESANYLEQYYQNKLYEFL